MEEEIDEPMQAECVNEAADELLPRCFVRELTYKPEEKRG
jgi:hypothetical protein